MTLTIPAKGFYRLTADVRNPKPDRRSKRTDSHPVWPKGTRVYVNPPSDRMRGHIDFDDGSRALFGEPETHYPEVSQGNGILDVLEPAPPTVGQTLKKAWSTPSQLLARAVDLGKLTLDDIKALDAEMEAWDDDLIRQFDEAHEI